MGLDTSGKRHSRILSLFLGTFLFFPQVNGSSELASWSAGLKRFAAARQVDCLVCGTNSECRGNHCACAAGYAGDQPLDCFKSKNLNQRPSVLLSIYHEPPETDSYRTCISPTWKRIADVGEKGTAIVDPFLEAMEDDYRSCLRMLKDSSVTIYLRVSMEFGFVDPRSKIETLWATYESFVDGFYLDSPPSDLSESTVTESIYTIKTLKRSLKAAISASDATWNVKLVNHPNSNYRADLVVVFEGTFARWSEACGALGAGPYCRSQKSFKTSFDILMKRIFRGQTQRSQFAAIIYDLKASEMKETLTIANEQGVGVLSLSNFESAETNRFGPSYWDFMLLNFLQDVDCGCEDLNECKTNEHNCHALAACDNTIGSFACRCPAGMVGDGVGEAGCTDDPCAKCSEGTICSAEGNCICDEGSFGTGLKCDTSDALVPLHRPKSSHDGDEDICEDPFWLAAGNLALDKIATTVLVDLSVNGRHNYIICLRMLKENGVKIYHDESLWNGFKEFNIIASKLDRVVAVYEDVIDGIYLSNAPNNQFDQYGGVDLFGKLVNMIKLRNLGVIVDVRRQREAVKLLSGTLKSTTGKLIPPIEKVIFFYSNFNDWVKSCDQQSEGLFCEDDSAIMPAIARGLISRAQLAGLFYSVSPEDAERVFRAAQTKNIGSIFVSSADINVGNKAEFDEQMVEQFTYSLKGLWPECGCYDHDECSEEDEACLSEDEICVNTDGSYSCINPSTALGLSSRARAIGCFNTCDEKAECILGKCRCSAGYQGTGQDCNAPANDVKFVVTIRQRPTIRNGKCVDAYWNEISQIKDVIVVLEIYSIKWMPCINLLEQKGIVIYAKIDAKGGELEGDPVAVLTKKFENLKRVFKGKVNPYLTNPGRTFETTWVYKAMENARNQNLKLGIQAADAEWSVDCVIKKKIDLVVVFKDPVKKFTQSCGEGGPGPFCATRNARNLISEMVAALNQGKLSKDVFAVILYNSHSRDVKAVLELSETFKIDRIWLTERPFYSTVRPKLLDAVQNRIAAGKSIDQSRCGCRDINECESDICHSNAVCQNTEGSFECSCGSGFDGNGRVCLTINECTKGTHDCSDNADCLDTVDGFICACSSGFTGDGKSCVDINECEKSKNICGENSICKNTAGSFSCNCAPGFESQDDECVDIDECVHFLHDCAAQASCENNAGSFTCSCKEGFVGSGVICNDIDECTSENACTENALCTNSFGSFTCTCARGFEGDGKSECLRNTCKECSDGAICSEGDEGCICPAGTRGPATKCEEQKLIVPIRSIPLVSLKAGICIDEWWKEIAALGKRATVLLVFPARTWLPCIRLLRSNGVDVYQQVNARKSLFSNMKRYLTKQVQQIKSEFGGQVNGAYFMNPGIKGFAQDHFAAAFDTARQSKLKVGMQLAGVQFDANTVASTDLSVVFIGHLNEMMSNCGVHGPGPFCGAKTRTSQTMSIKQNIANGVYGADKLGAIVFNVPNRKLEEVFELAEADGVGAIYANDFGKTSEKKPTYWKELSGDQIGSKSNQDCGCSDVDECAENENICGAGICQNIESDGYSCECVEGFAFNGETCIDLDECASAVCDENATCENVDGGFSCSCNSGFAGDGFQCTDFNECDIENICAEDAACENFSGGHSCICKRGFVGDGTSCEDIDECTAVQNPCTENSQCENTRGSFSCKCLDGFKMHGGACVNVDECANGEHTCHEMADCIDTEGSFACSCRRGFSGDGATCQRQLCTLCAAGSTCTGSQCTCSSGFRGNGIACTSSTSVVVPINTAPIISPRTSECIDPVWLDIAKEFSVERTVILDGVTISWLPCIKTLVRSFADVYATIHVKRADLSDNKRILAEIQEFIAFGDTLSGIHFQTDEILSYKIDEWAGLFDLCRLAGFKISIDGYSNNWDLRIVSEVDFIVVFDAQAAEFGLNCFAKHSRGPFCRQNQIAQDELKKIENAVESGLFSRSKFGAIVRNVPERLVSQVLADAENSLTGSIFVTSHGLRSASFQLPDYWSAFLGEIEGFNSQRKTSSCGCEEINECENDPCPQNSKCFNSIGSFDCICDEGFAMSQGGLCLDLDECSLGLHSCAADGQCENLTPGFQCSCLAGFEGDGRSCLDIDECARGIHSCSENGICENTFGSFSCSCRAGFIGNGETCDDVDECSIVDSICAENSSCENTEGSFACFCLPGFTGDALERCDDVDECSRGNHLCHSMSSCLNTLGSYSCQCALGWSGNGRLCQEEICGLCDSSASCGDQSDCACQAGYKGSGYKCPKLVNPVPISSTPATEDGLCSDSYWKAVSEKRGVAFILRNMDSSWQPCISSAQEAGAIVLGSLDIIDTNRAELLAAKLGLDGFYFEAADYRDEESVAIFRKLKEAGFFVAANGHFGKWDFTTVQNTDLVITFSGSEFDYLNNCVFDLCLDENEDETLSEIEEAIKKSFISRTRFGTIIHEAKVDQLGSLFENVLRFRSPRSIFVSNKLPSEYSEVMEESIALTNEMLAFTAQEVDFTDCGCEDIDECLTLLKPCPDDSSCTNTNGGFRCSCNAGFADAINHVTGRFICKDIDECQNKNLCDKNAACENQKGGFVCQCNDGFRPGPLGECADIDECQEQLDNCNVMSTCINNEGGFTCSCIDGYEGDGFNCTDTDECRNAGDNSCSRNAFCENTVGSYNCVCKEGFAGDGRTCEDMNECSMRPCHLMADCSNSIGSFACECIEPSWNGNGFSCTKDVCSGCIEQSRCEAENHCSCPPGFSGSGYTCPKNTLVIPVKVPPPSGAFDVCTDEYWNQIASDDDNCVFIDARVLAKSVCLDQLARKNIQIYISVDVSDISVENIKAQILDITQSSPVDLAGVHLKNPNTEEGFEDSSFDVIFEFIRSLNLKISILGYGERWDINTVQKVDSIVVFEGGFDEFMIDCGDFGNGPFCRQNQLSSSVINEILYSVKSDYIDRGKFMSFFFDVPMEDIEEILDEHFEGDLGGGIFISDQKQSSLTYRPSYFQHLQHLVLRKSRERNKLSNCGCRDVDECAAGTSTCPSHSDCTNIAGGYRCSCSSGFAEIIREGKMTCIDVDECLVGSHQCSVNAACHNTVGSYECSCASGFAGDGKNCGDIDECSEPNACMADSHCVNFPGTFACICDSGFSGSGRSIEGCQDVDECLLRTATCPENSKCSNIRGGFTCNCNPGYERRSDQCVNIDECAENLDQCHPMARCSDTDGSYFCECLGDLRGDGYTCTQDICASCASGATCDGDSCTCADGFRGSGVECPTVDGLMVPMDSALIPSFDEATRQCTDPYWLTIAQIPGSSVIIDNPSGKWKPCMNDILSKGVDMYIRLSTTQENAVSKLNFITANFKNRFSGVYLEPCSEHVLTLTIAKSLGLKVAIDLSDCFVLDEYVKSADMVTLYRGNLENFDASCGHYGAGPFCKTERDEDVDALYQWSASSENQLPKFVSMIFEVPASAFTAAVRSHYSQNFRGGMFITDSIQTGPRRPSYFRAMSNLVLDHTELKEPCDCVEIDECAEGSAECPANSRCSNSVGGYDCICLDGFEMISTGECVDVNECRRGSGLCHSEAICINNLGSFDCSCKDGFIGSGANIQNGCVDADECAMEKDNCSENGFCENTHGSYNCVCKDGFAGSGQLCEDIDECAQMTHDCDENSSCENEDGSFSCKCLSGYAALDESALCVDIDECSLSSHDCHLMAECENTRGSYACSCADGWHGDGTICSQHICELCSDEAECENGETCVCNRGLQGTGVACAPAKFPFIVHPDNSCATLLANLPIEGTMFIFTQPDDPCSETILQNGGETWIISDTIQDQKFSGILVSPQLLSPTYVENLRNEGFLVGVDLSDSADHKITNVEILDNLDFILKSLGSMNEYLTSCSSSSNSELCLKTSDVILANVTEKTKIGHILFDVAWDEFPRVLDTFEAIGGNIFLTDKGPDAAGLPVYLDDEKVILARKSAGNCGCSDIDECAIEAHNCPEHSSCVNEYAGYVCECNKGFFSESGECHDVDECQNDPCPVHSKCTNTLGSFDCLCDAGFVMDGGELSCLDVDECSFRVSVCLADEKCSNKIGSFSCEMERNTNFDECQLGTHLCPVNSICTNSYYRLTPRGYTCACAAGFECNSCVTGMNVDDFSCDDVDECSAGDHDCHESQICNNLPGTFECLCEENFELSAAGECVPVDPCAEGNHNCPALADCNAISSGDPGDPNFQCSCQPGYEFEPMNSNDSIIVCADVDECAKHQHLCSGNELCHNLEPGYECLQAECAQLDCSHSCENNTCVCPEGMKLDDTEINCQIKDSEVDIMCDGDSMKVLVRKAFYSQMSVLQLADPTCNLENGNVVDVNEEYFMVTAPLDGCGTRVEVQDKEILFINTLYDNKGRAQDPKSGAWIRTHSVVTLEFACAYQTVVDVDSQVIVEPSYVKGSSRGTGNFDFKLQTYSDSTYSTVASDGFKTGELMFFDIKLDRAVDGVQFTVTDCTVWDAAKEKHYNVIEDQCLDSYIKAASLDPVLVPFRARFSYIVFEFLGAKDASEVILSCKIAICHPGDSFYSQCAAGCQLPNEPEQKNRKRRSAELDIVF